MPSNFTEHYQLNQWSPGDQVLREDFNADNAKLDAAIPRIIIDTYTGDGQPERIIPLPFTPRLVVVMNDAGGMQSTTGNNPYYYGGIALPDKPVSGYGRDYLWIVENGFKIIYLDEKQGSYTCHYTGNNLNSFRIFIAIS